MWKLEKAAYGLDDASRHWYFSVREDLMSFDFKQSEIDKALFRWYQDDQLKGIFLIHIDDFLFVGTDQFFIDKITNKYKIGNCQNRNFTYVGLKVEESSSGIRISQNEYISEMKEILIARTRETQRFVASLRLKNEIGERQDSLRRMGRACAGMLLASIQTGTNHLALTFLTSGRTFYEVSS